MQCLELYTACILSESITGIKRFIFQGNFTFSSKQSLTVTWSSLLKFSAPYSERGYILWNLSTVHNDITTIHLNFLLFQVFFNRSSIPDRRSPILDPSFPDPSFPVNLEVLLITIVPFFDHWSWSNHLLRSRYENATPNQCWVFCASS